MTIKKFDRAGAAEFEQDLKSLLEVLEDHCGVKIDIDTIRYDPDAGKLYTKIEVSCAKDEKGESVGPRELEYLAWAIRKPLGQVLDLGGIFSSKEKKYKITGYNNRARKYPLMALEISSGKSYKFPIKYAFKD